MAEYPSVTIYTDGACDPNPGSGGWAALLQSGKTEKLLTGSDPDTTNNRMELTAAIRSLQALTQPSKVVIFTDSDYLRKGITEWMPNWKRKNWRRKGGALANVDLWKMLDNILGSHQVEWRWVRGHAGNLNNERVDRAARRAINRAMQP